MKKKSLVLALILPALVFLNIHDVVAQETAAERAAEKERIDSLVIAIDQKEVIEENQRENSEELSNLKSEKRNTKAKAKEAQRIEGEANDAARESKSAYRKEKKAQRTRESADKQSKKAAKARAVSDEN